jgi:glycosyltransferase involved in cell wall biosynthesis
MSKPFKISVICPTYDRFDFLQQTILSVKLQTYPIHEIIVIDDGSTDERYKTNFDKDIKILHLSPNSREKFGRPNISYTLNEGIKISTGDYIARIDDDDIWLPNKLKLQVDAMMKTGCKISSTEGYITRIRWTKDHLEEQLKRGFTGQYQKFNSEYCMDYFKQNQLLPNGYFEDIWTESFLNRNNFVIHSSVLFEKELFYKVGEYITDYGKEDWNLWKRMLKHTNLCYVQDTCFVYHLR